MTKLTALTLCLGLATATTTTTAGPVEDFRADLAYCEEMANLRASSSGYSSTTNSAIGGLANILGAVIAGRDTSYALSGAAQQGIHGVANDARAAEYRRQSMIDQCLRERQRQANFPRR